MIQRKDTTAFVIMVILFFLIGSGLIYKSYQNRINAIRLQIEEEEKKNEIIGSINILDKKTKSYKQSFFSTSEITPVLDRVSELSEQAGISVETFNPLPAIHQEKYTELPIQLPLSCEYHQLGKFLSLIESNQELIKVKKLKIYKPTVINPNETKIPKVDITLCGIYLKK